MTARIRRIRVTAGTTGWARAPYDPDRDPDLPPDPPPDPHDTEHLESPMATDHTLTPADIAARCRVLDCTVTVSGGNYKITPPADATTEDGSRPSVVHIPADADFRSKADRTLSVRNLRHNGVDVFQDRDWSNRPTDTEPDPAPEIPKLEIQGPRPSASWSKVPEAPDESNEQAARASGESEDAPAAPEEIVAMLVAEMRRVVEPINEDIAKLAARIDAWENAPRPPAAASAHSRRLDQLDQSVGNLARRTAHLETTTESVASQGTRTTTGLEQAGAAIQSLVASVDQLGARLDALEASAGASDTAAQAPAEPSWIDAVREQVREALAPFGAMYLPRVNIAEIMGLDVSNADDPDIKRLSYVLKVMRSEGVLESTGVRSGVRWRLAQVADETPEEGTP